ncbi:hypothetical protein [Polyangium jinanense]|uniref:Kazal-like domain-containing protein n=1 Tax=Polyangium jinanense TaxID=2829994 RepID=A0A9X3X2B2_9BACT|nr:hypothetical protein [Polyangium jinanense]MDC3955695.1 hypothetical protein [Polyangium jinanense]MDC3982337.1 hypothetical protein [Polyangium jinanense]
MKFLASLALFASALALGCASTQPPTDGSAPTATVPVEPAPTAATTEVPPPPADKPTETEAPPPVEKPAGRLAFQACSEESRKAAGCTRDLRPVCGEMDNGIRCIKAPCPSTTPRTFPNACTACVEPKVTGYWPMSCEDMNKPTAP